MNSYGTLLKSLIRFTNIKLTNLAEAVGYDTSYISKWCNKDKLPAAKAAAQVNQCLAAIFSAEIIAQDEIPLFAREFDVKLPENEAQLTAAIYGLLKTAYKKSYDNLTDHAPAALTNQRLLLWSPDIKDFFDTDLPRLIQQLKGECQILCTMDICGLLPHMNFEQRQPFRPSHPVSIKMGMNFDRRNGQFEYVSSLYALMNHYNQISFSFYDNRDMDALNILVVKDCLALQCALDRDYHISIMSVITDIPQVNAIYQKVSGEFTFSRLLIPNADSDELLGSGYRTQFYAQDHFQIMTVKGFEFLLPPEIIPRLIQAAREQGFDENMSKIITHLGITWEEIFEKSSADFYLLKTRLIQYAWDGIIYFTDVVYRMSVEERKSHIQHVLDILQKNPGIRFHIIDDAFISNADTLFRMSLYNNRKRLFLKNIDYFQTRSGPSFYTIQNDALIEDVSRFLDELPKSPYCKTYCAEDVLRFYEKYGTMIDRLLSIGS